MSILLDTSVKLVENLNYSTNCNDWNYAFFDAPQRNWSAIFRNSWNNNAQGVQLRQAQFLGNITHRPVLWFELANEIENVNGILNYYLCFDDAQRLGAHLPVFTTLITNINNGLFPRQNHLNDLEVTLMNTVQNRLGNPNRMLIFKNQIMDLNITNYQNYSLKIAE